MRSKNKLLLSFFLAISLLIILIDFFFKPAFVRAPVNLIFSPIREFTYGIKVNLFVNENEEIEKLKKENQELLKKLSDYDKLRSDNEALKSQFETSFIEADSLLAAKVIGFKGPFFTPQSLIINKGEKQGVEKNMTVIFKDNLVGIIANTSSSTSEIILPLNQRFSTVGIESSSGATGIVRGMEDFILFDRVAITDELYEGDLILTKGEVDINGLGVKEDIIIGKIKSINKSDAEPFQTAKIESLYDFAKLSTVFVIQN